MGSKHFYRFSYAVQGNRGRKLDPHQMRDGEAFAELSPVLCSLGYQWGGNFMNFPDMNTTVDTSCLKREDLLVLTTRPPLNDKEEGLRRQVLPSHTSLEREVFGILKRYFSESSRLYIKLSRDLEAKLPREFANRAYIEFKQYKRGKEYAGGNWTARKGIEDRKWERPTSQKQTVGYLLQTPSFAPGFPQILTVFGMGGIETLALHYLLRKRFRAELEFDRPRFTMVEIAREEVPEKPTSLSFVDTWQAEILFTVFLDEVPGP